MSNFYTLFPKFNLQEVILREINPIEDAEQFLAYMNDPNVAPFLADCDRPKTVNDAINELTYWYNLFKHRRSIYWAIAENNTNYIIGTVGFNQYSDTHRKVEISYDLDYNYWSKGIMTRALEKIIEFAFDKMNVIRIQATVAYHNDRSIRVLERLGFTREGIMKNFCILEGKPIDYYMYAKLK